VTLQQVYPHRADVVGQDNLDEIYAVTQTEWLRINLVSSIDGASGGADGTSASLTMGDDRKILGAIRRASDVVLLGAASVRSERYLLPQSVPLAVVTMSGDLAGDALPNRVDDGQLFVVCPGSVADRISLPGARVIALEAQERITPVSIIAALRDAGFGSIVCEGGPSLASQLLSASLVDDLCLTTSPLIVGGAQPLFGSSELNHHALSLNLLLVDDLGVSYARWSSNR